jgi:poly-gamma-glutamate synthesis protein (capsule biosynthesis protein)
VTLEEQGPVRLEALPLKLDYCHTRAADGDDAAWVRRRFREACARLADVREEEGRLVVTWEPRLVSVSATGGKTESAGTAT